MWRRPRQNLQRTLFPLPTDQRLPDHDVSPDEIKAWYKRGWISFDIDRLTQIDQPEDLEISFVRNIARSGLPIHTVNELLSKLEDPYSYDPVATAYHFVYGWVESKPEDAFELIDRHLSDWIEQRVADGDFERLQELRDQLDDCLPEEAADEYADREARRMLDETFFDERSSHDSGA